VEIAIQDNGVGIPEENLPRIFDPFYTQFETGTGLGLSIVQRILTQHNAKICVESKPQEGATFTIFFPLGKKTGEKEK
jgi:two-component system sporulation sensor kinase A